MSLIVITTIVPSAVAEIGLNTTEEPAGLFKAEKVASSLNPKKVLYVNV